jgi:hypothetical protein
MVAQVFGVRLAVYRACDHVVAVYRASRVLFVAVHRALRSLLVAVYRAPSVLFVDRTGSVCVGDIFCLSVLGMERRLHGLGVNGVGLAVHRARAYFVTVYRDPHILFVVYRFPRTLFVAVYRAPRIMFVTVHRAPSI